MGTGVDALNKYDTGLSFLSVYPNYDLSLLPKWVVDNIGLARVVGKSQNTVILPDERKYHLKNKLNHLSGSEWTYFINSVINTRYKTTGEESYAHGIRKLHPSPKPPQLMKDIIEFFTKEKELVFDYFMGVGGTLLGAALCGRRAAGVDLNNDYIITYQKAALELGLPIFNTMAGDAITILKNKNQMNKLTGDGEISLLLLDPPYGDMMSRAKTGPDIKVHGNKGTPFTNDAADLGNMDHDIYLDSLKHSVELSIPYIKKEGHVVVFIKDLQPKKKAPNLIHADIVYKLNEIPTMYYKGMKIWADQTTKLYPYGYPFSFVANQIHQYILVFRIEE